MPAGLKKHGLPANSGAVHGARYNARVLARHIAATQFAAPAALERPPIPADELVDSARRTHLSFVTGAVAPAGVPRPGRLARPGRRAARRGHRAARSVRRRAGDDGAGDAIALTLEADGSGAIYPVLYVRRDGRLDEHMFEPDIRCSGTTRPRCAERLAEIVAERHGGVARVAVCQPPDG